MRFAKVIALFCFLLLAASASAQVDLRTLGKPIGGNRPSSSTGGGPAADANASSDSSATDRPAGIEDHVEIPDSILQASVFIFHRLSSQVKILDYEHPSLSPTGAQFCDVLDALDGNYYLTVTELGHPHLALAPDFDASLGLIYKSTLYPAFYKTPDNVNLYQVQHPYSVLSYNSSLNKDYQVHLTHTQNINDHWNYALDYHLITPQGLFANSSATDHLFDFNTNFYSPDTRYQVAAGFIWQRMILGENDGLARPEAFLNNQISNMAGIPVNDNKHSSFSGDATVFVRQSFNTVRQVEWYRPIRQQFTDTVITYDTLSMPHVDTVSLDTVFLDSIISNTQYQLRDSIVGYDTIQPHAPHCYNTGVFGFDFQWDRQKYRYVDSSLYHQLSASLYWTNDAYLDYRWHNPLKLYGGIRPQLSWLNLSSDCYTDTLVRQMAIYPFARVEISPWPAATLNGYAEASPDLSEYNLDACLEFPFRDSVGNSSRQLSIHGIVQAYEPELIYYAQCLHEFSLVVGDLHTVGVRKLELDYHREDLFDIHLAAQHVDHNIWFQKCTLEDETINFMPYQTDGNALLLQARVNLYLSLGSWFHIDMQQLAQYSTDQDQIRVPLFASKNSVYADFSLFHDALHTQVGADIRYHTPFKADGYAPQLGIFYRQDDIEVGGYVWADFFINLQIKRASIYAKAGHLNSLIEPQSYYILPNYPSKPFGFFFGLTWRFFD